MAYFGATLLHIVHVNDEINPKPSVYSIHTVQLELLTFILENKPYENPLTTKTNELETNIYGVCFVFQTRSGNITHIAFLPPFCWWFCDSNITTRTSTNL